MVISLWRFLDRQSAWMLVGFLAWVTITACQPGRNVEGQEPARRDDQGQIVYWRQRYLGQVEDSVLESIRLKDKKTTKLATNAPYLAGNGGFCVALSPNSRRVAYVSGALRTDNMDGSDHHDRKVHIRALEDPKAKTVSLEVEGDHVCWSPDGRQLLV